MYEDGLINDGANPIHDTRTYFSYGIGLDYRFYKSNKASRMIQITVGHRYIKETVDRFFESQYDASEWKEHINYHQVNYSLGYFIGNGFSLERISFNGDIGLSLQRIGRGHQDWSRSIYTYSGSENSFSEQKSKIGGGWGFGLAAVFEIEFKINDKITFSSAINNNFSFLMFLGEDHHKGQFYDLAEGFTPDMTWDTKEKNRMFRLTNSRVTPSFMIRFALN